MFNTNIVSCVGVFIVILFMMVVVMFMFGRKLDNIVGICLFVFGGLWNYYYRICLFIIIIT